MSGPDDAVEKIQAMLDASPFIPSAGTARGAARCGGAADGDGDAADAGGGAAGQGRGQFHGGAIAGLIDTAGDFALVILLGGGVPTINLRIDYLRPATGAALLAVASVRRAGRTIGVVDVDVTDPEGRLVAIGRGSYAMAVG